LSDNDWMLWSHVPPKLAQREKRKDLLFSLANGANRMECWLLYHGEFGVEAQWHRDGSLFYSRVFVTKALAVAWAESERDEAKAVGWQEAAPYRSTTSD